MSSRPNQTLDERVRESKDHWLPAPPADAEAEEARLFARIDAYDRTVSPPQAGVPPRLVHSGPGRFWAPLALASAVAAGAVFVARPHAPVSEPLSTAPPPAASAVALAPEAVHPLRPRPTAPAVLEAVTRGGSLRVDGREAKVHEVAVHDGQTVLARGGDAVFLAPGRVDWILESGSEVRAVRAGTEGGAIVLALAVGGVEAQVVPVPAGEAFAVDVGGVRVAVHGTHLRVFRGERGGDHVVVDLSEGVISVGAPPRAGSTLGHLVTAPAHVEFSVADLDGTLRVDHEPANVRPPVDPASLASGASGESSDLPTSAARPTATPPPPPPNLPPKAPPPPPATPTEAILAAARACADETVHGGAGEITIRSVLTVDVNGDGTPRLASFDPPLAPDLQACVGKAVYATRWDEGGAHTIPIEIHK